MRRTGVWLVAALLALALGLRLYGIDWGLPQVYEEAYPFKKSWPMWGWDAGTAFDPNPHFFNYPSLFFYVQFIGQGLLYLLLRVFGTVGSNLDYRVLYALDKTPFYIMGRSLTVLFAAATVLATFQLGRRTGGLAAGATAAFLVAVNAVHISKSQVIEVDVPLTFFLVMTLFYAVRILDEPRRRHYLLAGLCGGLATSTKYSGMLLPLPILLAHILAQRRTATRVATSAAAPPDAAAGAAARQRDKRARRRAPAAGGGAVRRGTPVAFRNLVVAGATFAAAFLLTSPYVLLDHESFWLGFNYERLHMRLGHFGLDRTPAIVYYAKVLTGSLLGWPLALAGAAGLVYLGGVRRQAWALVLGLFPAVYVGLISSFSMKAERYILPLLPIAALLASAFAVEMLSRARLRRPLAAAALAGLALLLAAPSLVGYARGLSRLRPDNRTLARQWIEAHVPSGACIASESYGPEPLSAIDLANLSPDVRERIREQVEKAKVYAVIAIPMIQVRPELLSVFYDLSQYDDYADYLVTSSSVVSRYRKDPRLFAKQLAFYDEVARRYELVREFGPGDGVGPTLSLYRNPRHERPFAQRGSVPSPAATPRLPDPVPGLVGPHYQRLAVNLESYGYYVQAAETYFAAASYAEPHPTFRRDVLLGAVRSYLLAKRPSEAAQVLEQAMRTAKGPADIQYWQDLRKQLFAAAR